MNEEAKKIVVISASPKAGENSTSTFLAALGGEILKAGGTAISIIDVRQSINKKRTDQDFAAMLQADAMIFIFPLYFFCLPGILMRFLQDYFPYYARHQDKAAGAKIYAVINCGFPEPSINTEAAGVIENFSEQTGNRFRFALLIGGGGMLHGTKDAPFMKKTMAAIKDGFHRMLTDSLSRNGNTHENIQIKMNFPRWLYLFMGNTGWSFLAKKHGLKKKDLYKRPYEH